jgi:hypothetical protein
LETGIYNTIKVTFILTDDMEGNVISLTVILYNMSEDVETIKATKTFAIFDNLSKVL